MPDVSGADVGSNSKHSTTQERPAVQQNNICIMNSALLTDVVHSDAARELDIVVTVVAND